METDVICRLHEDSLSTTQTSNDQSLDYYTNAKLRRQS